MKDEKTNENELNEGGSEEQISDTEAKTLELEAKCADLNDKYLRTLAEYENFRRRTQKEREGLYSDAYVDAISRILPVIDNIERITTFASDEKLSEGINLIITSMKETLNKMGVTEIETKTFDPNFHNAVMHVEDDTLGEGEIVEVFQKGYLYKEKVIRYAMVKVAN